MRQVARRPSDGSPPPVGETDGEDVTSILALLTAICQDSGHPHIL